MHYKACNVKMPSYKGAELEKYFFGIYSKVNQFIHSSIPIYSPEFKALSSMIFMRYCGNKISSIFFQWAITQERDIILVSNCFVRIAYEILKP